MEKVRSSRRLISSRRRLEQGSPSGTNRTWAAFDTGDMKRKNGLQIWIRRLERFCRTCGSNPCRLLILFDLSALSSPTAHLRSALEKRSFEGHDQSGNNNIKSCHEQSIPETFEAQADWFQAASLFSNHILRQSMTGPATHRTWSSTLVHT